MARTRWRPRSLLQLVLIGFGMVMLPLGILLGQSSQALKQLSVLADESARQAVEYTRRAQSISSLALDIERTARQYQVVEDADLLDVLQQQQAQFIRLLSMRFETLPTPETEPMLQALMPKLATLGAGQDPTPDAALEALTELVPLSQEYQNSSRQQVDQALEQMRQHTLHVRQRIWWQAALLIGLSLLLVVLFSYLIVRPIHRLERRIRSIGDPDAPEEKTPLRGPAELVMLGERLDWLTERLDEVDAQKRQFLRHMSHELKTPLASIREAGDLLHDQVLGPLTDEQRDITDLLSENSRQLQALIEQLLDYNLLQGHQDVDKRDFDLRALLDEVLVGYRLTVRQKAIEVILPDPETLCFGDRRLIRRSLDNLISNAVFYGDEQGIIRVEIERQNDNQKVRVGNTGPKIPPADAQHIFEPFRQGSAKRNGPVKGSGIGLSVAADCARVQGGQIHLIDRDDVDVCFEIILPTA
ncbi:hypothetical protein BFW38_01175 [Terasakiispira papahanaumokuakeensis]|uniref:histidine kinase n=2 Tax=Terasakiispira papahanaumokuakeensis TaxID=197479 RepID=A0A1E2VDS5_9GAMM|nr:hypothetical protein BFW38_01175 [Terasakiispira papahanaumokuakeensis]